MPRVKVYIYDSTRMAAGSAPTANQGPTGSGEYRQTILQRAAQRLEEGSPPPLTPMQALMEAAPFEEPAESLLEREHRFDPLMDALSTLTERERWVVEALFWRRMPLRALATELALSKTHVARLRDGAIRKLGEVLSVDADQLLLKMSA